MAPESKTKLEGKVALVTGGNSGIGLATAKTFLENGAQVIVTASSKETFIKAQKELGHIFDVVQCNIADLVELDKLFAHIKTKYGHLDVVFANAGIAEFKPSLEVDATFYDRIMDIDVKGTYFTVTKSIPLLRDGSSVILNGSVAGSVGFAGSSVYSAAKAALRSFVQTWTVEILPEKIRFNVLSPGAIETPIFNKLGLSDEEFSGFSERLISNIPAKRFGKAEEMAGVALFLASSDSSYICGANIQADGGRGQI